MPPTEASQPVVNISIITPKPERFDEFLELQLAQFRRVRGLVQGLQGSRCYRSTDGRQVVLVALFETAEDALRFSQDERFTDHIARVRPLIESAVPGTYEPVYGFGDL